MNASGLLWLDAALICFFMYVFWGGWLATLAGWVVCGVIGFRQKRAAVALACAAPGFLPVLYIAALSLLGSHGPQPASSTGAGLSLMVGMVVAIAAGPAVAVLEMRRGGRDTD
jgi:hypothetical protein